MGSSIVSDLDVIYFLCGVLMIYMITLIAVAIFHSHINLVCKRSVTKHQVNQDDKTIRPESHTEDVESGGLLNKSSNDQYILQSLEKKLIEKEGELNDERRQKEEIMRRTNSELEKERNEKEEALQRTNSELEKERNEKEEALQSLQSLMVRLTEAEGTLNDERREKEDIMRRTNSELEKERNEKEEALRRLSAIMSSRLKDENPNVVNLNDQNRPTKIGEKYSELYDNQWTDAYDELESIFNDNEQFIIFVLRTVLEQCFLKCREDATDQLDNFRRGIETLAGSFATKSKTLTKDMMQRLKEERKTFAVDCQPSVQSVERVITGNLATCIDSSDFLKHPKLQAYLEECVRLCWFMVIQDPPMVLVSNPEQNQSNLFRSYLHNGPYMKFVVWPALLLSDQGSLVMKGTAEFTKQQP